MSRMSRKTHDRWMFVSVLLMISALSFGMAGLFGFILVPLMS